MSTNFDRRLERLEAAVGTAGNVDFAELLAAARVQWRNDPEGMRQWQRAWVADVEARLAAGEVLSEMTMELLEAHRRRERFEQMEARS
jgi:hypothetical protein